MLTLQHGIRRAFLRPVWAPFRWCLPLLALLHGSPEDGDDLADDFDLQQPQHDGHKDGDLLPQSGDAADTCGPHTKGKGLLQPSHGDDASGFFLAYPSGDDGYFQCSAGAAPEGNSDVDKSFLLPTKRGVTHVSQAITMLSSTDLQRLQFSTLYVFDPGGHLLLRMVQEYADDAGYFLLMTGGDNIYYVFSSPNESPHNTFSSLQADGKAPKFQPPVLHNEGAPPMFICASTNPLYRGATDGYVVATMSRSCFLPSQRGRDASDEVPHTGYKMGNLPPTRIVDDEEAALRIHEVFVLIQAYSWWGLPKSIMVDKLRAWMMGMSWPYVNIHDHGPAPTCFQDDEPVYADNVHSLPPNQHNDQDGYVASDLPVFFFAQPRVNLKMSNAVVESYNVAADAIVLWMLDILWLHVKLSCPEAAITYFLIPLRGRKYDQWADEPNAAADEDVADLKSNTTRRRSAMQLSYLRKDLLDPG